MKNKLKKTILKALSEGGLESNIQDIWLTRSTIYNKTTPNERKEAKKNVQKKVDNIFQQAGFKRLDKKLKETIISNIIES